MTAISLVLWSMTGAASAAPGDHIRAGELEIVPDVDVGAEFRSNVYRQEEGGPGAANLLVSPGLKVKADGQDHTLGAELDWKLRKFFFVGAGDDPAALIEGRAQRLDRFNEFTGSANLNSFKRNVVGLALSEQIAMQNWTADAPYAELPYSSHFRNGTAASLRVSPTSALSTKLGGMWTFDSYLAPGPAQREEPINQRNMYGPSFEASWAFLPRTSVVVRGHYLFHRWKNNFLESDPGIPGSEIPIANSNQLKSWAGLEGRITEKLFTELLFGYGAAPYDADSVPGTISQAEDLGVSVSGSRRFLMQSQIRYDIRPGTPERPGTRLTAGYVRDFRDSFFTNWVGVDRAFVSFDLRVGKVYPTARYELRFENYFGEISRNDTLQRVQTDVVYRFREYASASVGGWWHSRGSTDATVEYDDFNVHLFATFQY